MYVTNFPQPKCVVENVNKTKQIFLYSRTRIRKHIYLFILLAYRTPLHFRVSKISAVKDFITMKYIPKQNFYFLIKTNKNWKKHISSPALLNPAYTLQDTTLVQYRTSIGRNHYPNIVFNFSIRTGQNCNTLNCFSFICFTEYSLRGFKVSGLEDLNTTKGLTEQVFGVSHTKGPVLKNTLDFSSFALQKPLNIVNSFFGILKQLMENLRCKW